MKPEHFCKHVQKQIFWLWTTTCMFRILLKALIANTPQICQSKLLLAKSIKAIAHTTTATKKSKGGKMFRNYFENLLLQKCIIHLGARCTVRAEHGILVFEMEQTNYYHHWNSTWSGKKFIRKKSMNISCSKTTSSDNQQFLLHGSNHKSAGLLLENSNIIYMCQFDLK